jgi:hypothetical protein
MTGYLYALEIMGVGVRIGQSYDGERRVARHRKSLKSYGLSVDGRHFILGPIGLHEEREKEIHRRLSRSRVAGSREVFAVDFEAALESIRAVECWFPDQPKACPAHLATFSSLARELGMDRKVVACFVRHLGIEPIRLSGKGKGLTPEQVDRIRRAHVQVGELARVAG